MTKIEEGKQPQGKHTLKRKLSCFQNNQGPSNNHNLTMETILHRYHSLAKIHYEDTKRRHDQSNEKTLRNTQRMQQLTNLQKMASETHTLATNLLRSEEQLYRENQRERHTIERELKKAEQEKALAEDFLGSFASDGTFNQGGVYVDNVRGTIGGVPRKFLDLSHFPQLRRKGGGDVYNSSDDEDIIGYVHSENDSKRRHIIDCTEEDAQKMTLEEISYPTRIPITSLIPPFSSQAMETTTSDGMGVSSKTQKKNTNRIYITDATLAHVNGTYIQEVSCVYNNAPIFVRAGPPRKFMGFDCSVVLRRESISSAEFQALSRDNNMVVHTETTSNNGETTPHFIWKIGLVPAHRVSHSKMIGYYFAHEDASAYAAVMSSMDLMGEDESSYFEPPVDGWRVFHESGRGRTSGLKIFYEE